MFNEEESAKTFQEALIQWRNGNHDHRPEQRTGEVLPGMISLLLFELHFKNISSCLDKLAAILSSKDRYSA